MPAPIVVPQKQNPWEGMLMQMYLTKFQHKLDMDRVDAAAKIRQGEKKQEVQTQAKMAGWQEVPQSAQMQMQKSGTSPSDVEDIYGTMMRRPSSKIIDLGNGMVGIQKNGQLTSIHNAPSTTGKYSATATDQGLAILDKTTGKVTVDKGVTKSKNPTLWGTIEDAQKGDPQAQKNLDKYVEMQKEITKSRGAGYAYGRPVKVYDTKAPQGTNPWIQTNLGLVDEMNQKEPGRYVPESAARISIPGAMQSVAQAEAMKAFSKVPTGQRGSAVITSSQVYDKEMPGIIALRNKVASKGLLPDTRFQDMNKFKQWIGQKASDPDASLLRKKVKLLADGLQRAIGGSQGGEYSFKIAADILDPSFQGPTFESIVRSHGSFLREDANSYLNFGKLQGKTLQEPSMETASKGPKVGTIDQGYIFQGGDPANPKNWKKAK